MRKWLSLLAIITLFLTGCTRKTPQGPCIGINDKPDPKLLYRYDGLNIGMGILFMETAVVPLVVLFNEFQCPYATNPEAPAASHL